MPFVFSTAIRRPAVKAGLALVLAGLLSGCNSVGMSKLGVGTPRPETSANDTVGSEPSLAQRIFTSGKGPIDVDPEAFAKQPNCPPMVQQGDTYLMMKYEKGKENQPEALLYQAYIDDNARECRRDKATGEVRIKLGLAGRITPGPAWKGGVINLPVRVAVTTGDPDAKPLSSNLYEVPVTVAAGSPSVPWTLVEDKISIPADFDGRMLYGFDEGGAKKKGR